MPRAGAAAARDHPEIDVMFFCSRLMLASLSLQEPALSLRSICARGGHVTALDRR